MGAGITATDNMFSVREIPWHKLGSVLGEYPTRQKAQQIAHPWEVVQEPIYRMVPVIHTHTEDCYGNCAYASGELIETYELIEGFQANVRSDGAGTLGIVTETFEPVTNGTLYDIAEAIEGEAKGEVMFETAGSLNGGAKVWVLVRLREPLIVPGDPHGGVIPYYALQNAHDGSASLRGQSTLTRIVCANTAQAADMDAQMRGTEFKFNHTKNVGERIEEAREALAGWRYSIQNYRLQMEYLNQLRMDTEQVATFVERFIPAPPAHTATDRVMANVEKARTDFRNILGGVTCEGIDGTAYGMVQASIEYLNWGRKAHTEETRFRRSFLDRNRIVTDAVELALELAR